MAFINSPRFPTEIAFNSAGGPRFHTELAMSQGGNEQRNQKWRFTLGQWEIGLVNRNEATTRLLLGYFRTVARGKRHTFRFKDFLPGEAEGVNEALIRLSAGTYQLLKHYNAGSSTHYRIITKPVATTLQVRVNDVAVIPTSINDTTGQIVITPAPSGDDSVRADFEFDVPVRFDTDTLPIRRVDMNIYTWDSIMLYEQREESA